MKYKISVVIPNFNGLDLLAKNLVSVVTNTLSYDPDAEVIVVDDASKDYSVKYLKENFPKVIVLKHLRNRGFSATVNSGIKIARGDLIVLLNNDVLPINNYLHSVVDHFNDGEVFAVSFHEKGYGWAKGYFKDGFVQHSGGVESTTSHRTFWVNGGSGIFRASMLKKIRYFDEELFSPFYWEDIDLSYRGAKRGWKLIWEPKSCVIHEHESTIKKINQGKKDLIVQRNQLLFIWKNITSRTMIVRHLKGLMLRLSRHPGYIRIIFAALLKLEICLRKREIEIKESKICDEILLSEY